MILGRVVGALWASRKHARLEHCKMVLVRPYGDYRPVHSTELLVAVDAVDAGPGDDVVLCLGSPARWALGAANLPIDAAVLGVVDRCSFDRGCFSRDGTQRGRSLRFIGGRQPRGVDVR